MKVDKKQQKQIAIVAGAALALYLLYRWYASRSAGGTSTGSSTPATDTAASDYAALAGQQQSDAAALQGQNSQLQSMLTGQGTQEQSDVAALTAGLTGLGTQQAAFAGTIDQLGSVVQGLQGDYAGLTAPSTAAAATGTVASARTPTFGGVAGKIVGPGGGYRKIPGTTNTYIGKNGKVVSGSAIGIKPHKAPAHHSAPKQHHVAHPNPTHEPKKHYTPSKPNAMPQPHPKPHPKHKPKKSGAHR